MHKSSVRTTWALLLVVPMIAASCSPKPQTVAPTAVTFADPFAYCAAVGTVDGPDARYRGPQVPDEVIDGFKLAARLEASTEPMEMFKKTTIWRCMGGRVYTCNFGANLPCDAKANTDRTPTQALADFCGANPGSDVIPMSVTGHDTIYSWHALRTHPKCCSRSGRWMQQVTWQGSGTRSSRARRSA